MEEGEEGEDEGGHLAELGEDVGADGGDQPGEENRARQGGISVGGVEEPGVVKGEMTGLEPVAGDGKVIGQRIIADQRGGVLELDQGGEIANDE